MFGGFRFFITVAIVYESVLFCKSIAALRPEFYCHVIFFVQVEQIRFFLQVKFGVQWLRIAKFECDKVFCIIVEASVVFVYRL